MKALTRAGGRRGGVARGRGVMPLRPKMTTNPSSSQVLLQLEAGPWRQETVLLLQWESPPYPACQLQRCCWHGLSMTLCLAVCRSGSRLCALWR